MWDDASDPARRPSAAQQMAAWVIVTPFAAVAAVMLLHALADNLADAFGYMVWTAAVLAETLRGVS
ncbi:MAG: hypothetical protein EBR82_60560 [Caulobacteraceae bacterium]|nr:hypothetical protein [Caulobacteraceae bacterium]